jgi:hypothetical protein
MLIDVAVRCQGPCMREVPERETSLCEGARICARCRENHLKALLALQVGEAPVCSDCGSHGTQTDNSGNYKLQLHMRDGIYQFTCFPCGRAHMAKVRQMYQGTAVGKALNLV